MQEVITEIMEDFEGKDADKQGEIREPVVRGLTTSKICQDVSMRYIYRSHRPESMCKNESQFKA